MLTAAPDCVALALHIWVMVCEPGQVYPMPQPFVAVAPVLATVKPSWKPPLHEFVTDHVTLQPPEPTAEELGEGEALADCDGVGDGEADALADALGEDGPTVGVGEVLGEVPDTLVSTTTDSAGTETEAPDWVPVAMAGLAAS
jgi:hypothetical protein